MKGLMGKFVIIALLTVVASTLAEFVVIPALKPKDQA